MGNLRGTTVQAQAQTETQQAGLDVAKSLVERRAQKSVTWFCWIAGLLIVNLTIVLSGSDRHFLMGLGITEVLYLASRRLGGEGSGVALVLRLGIAGIFRLFGCFAHRPQLAAFVVGIILYALDDLLLSSFSDYFSACFHAFVLYILIHRRCGHAEVVKLEACRSSSWIAQISPHSLAPRTAVSPEFLVEFGCACL
jgi:hypothetical protein